MDVREKLVVLLSEKCMETCKQRKGYVCSVEECKRSKEKCCGFYADHLIANGVTVQESNGCEYCKEYEDLPEYFISGKPVGRVFDTCIQTDENGRWHLEVPCGADIGIRFCPMCGRELPQPPKGE